MIVLTDHIQALVHDIVARVPMLAHIGPERVLVFARPGRSGASGPLASCHCVARPSGDPGYFFWRDAETQRLVRRTAYVERHAPLVRVSGTRITHLVSLSLPRFCDQRLDRLPKRFRYPGEESWVAKLDTLIHELYHIAPSGGGLRGADGVHSGLHSPAFYAAVTRLTRQYLATNPPQTLIACLRSGFQELEALHGGVAGRVFSSFPSFPREYWEPIANQPLGPDLPLTNLRRPSKTEFSEADFRTRHFRADGTSRALPIMVEPGPVRLPVAA